MQLQVIQKEGISIKGLDPSDLERKDSTLKKIGTKLKLFLLDRTTVKRLNLMNKHLERLDNGMQKL